ncbi:MAG: hypothetical protein AVDCRST_MAG40-2613, partial [uncultured Gemmatimonadaceae bacterium]
CRRPPRAASRAADAQRATAAQVIGRCRASATRRPRGVGRPAV